MSGNFSKAIVALATAIVIAAPAQAQRAETILLNGRIVTLDAAAPTAEAIAIRDGKVAAVGSASEVRALADAKTKIVDLGGRTVIPGLMDSHMHAIRAAMFYATEVNWIGTHSITEAMARITAATKAKTPGAWLIVAGGWTPEQFAEKRKPTQAELVAAAPDNPVYIQHFYSDALLSPAGLKALNINTDADVPAQGKLERDAAGNPTGWISGNTPTSPTITALFGKLPLPTFDERVEGTRQFFRELNRLGLTAVSDPGGFNLTPADYRPLFKVWRDHDLTVRVIFSMFAQRPGKELEDYQSLTQIVPMGFGDGLLRFNGIGENVTWGMYNNDNPSDAQKEQYFEVARWAASRGMSLTQHWSNNKSVRHLLDVFERVNRESPIAPLRWSIAHLNDATDETLSRMKALGVGWTMQDALYFQGEEFIHKFGADAVRRMPPIVSAIKMDLHIGGGTDAHRVMSYNPFASLQWMLDGKTVGGSATRGPEELPSREQALRLYTAGSAWFVHDDGKRGALAAGKAADLAVLSKDYLTVPVDEVGGIESVLTMVGGRIVYAAGPFATMEEKRPTN